MTIAKGSNGLPNTQWSLFRVQGFIVMDFDFFSYKPIAIESYRKYRPGIL